MYEEFKQFEEFKYLNNLRFLLFLARIYYSPPFSDGDCCVMDTNGHFPGKKEINTEKTPMGESYKMHTHRLKKEWSCERWVQADTRANWKTTNIY